MSFNWTCIILITVVEFCRDSNGFFRQKGGSEYHKLEQSCVATRPSWNRKDKFVQSFGTESCHQTLRKICLCSVSRDKQSQPFLEMVLRGTAIASHCKQLFASVSQ